MLMRAEDGEQLTEDEIVANILLIFNAGHETTVNLIGNGMLALLRQPEALEALRADPSLMPTAVDELSRFDPPVTLATRIATADLEIGGRTVPKGAHVMGLLDAAGRDPERYPDPDRLDLARTEPKTLAFSAGPHFCLGACWGGWRRRPSSPACWSGTRRSNWSVRTCRSTSTSTCTACWSCRCASRTERPAPSRPGRCHSVRSTSRSAAITLSWRSSESEAYIGREKISPASASVTGSDPRAARGGRSRSSCAPARGS
ncbi:hypothetical protein A4U61_08420 [Streptomyces sp. H-KF8]|nr:hypothetical protein A4U61_08420 [Streptomyces sp. H-KF8]